MLCYKRREDIVRFLKNVKAQGKKLGFVPTMGALHDGHMSLIAKSKSENDLTICSIFVNPTQFNHQEDFDKYPISTTDDLLKLNHNACDIVFLPEMIDIYPNGTKNTKLPSLGKITSVLEGAHRPGHFDGVAQVVGLLLDIVQPDHLYMGQKDYQQALVVQKLLEVEKRHNTALVICPTQREADGLAMSSRNIRLSDEQRTHALGLSKALFYIKSNYKQCSNEQLIEHVSQLLRDIPELKLEYVSIASQAQLEPLTSNETHEAAVALVAAWMGNVRLIDNILL